MIGSGFLRCPVFLIILCSVLTISCLANEDIQLEEAWSYFHAGDHRCARITADSAMVMANRLGNDTLEASVWSLYGNIFRATGRPSIAREHHLRSLKIRTKLYGSNSLPTANSYHNLGNCVLQAGEFIEGLKWLSRAEKIRRKRLPRGHVDLAAVWNSLGTLFLHRQNYERALKYLEDAERIFADLSHHHLSKQLPVLINLAQVHFNCNRPFTSIDYLNQALVLQQRYPRYSRSSIRAEILGQLGKAYAEAGEMLRSRSCYRKALLLYDQLLPGEYNPRNRADVYNNFGNSLLKEQDFEQAIEQLEQARLLYTERRLPTDANLAACLVNLSVCFRYRGQFQEAIRHLESAQKLLQGTGQSDPLLLSDVFMNFGATFAEQNSLAASFHYFKKALQLKKVNHDVEGQIETLLRIGEYHLTVQQLPAAKKVYQEAEKLTSRLREHDTNLYWEIWFGQGQYYLTAGEPVRAREFGERAWELLEDVPGSFLRKLANTLLLAEIAEDSAEPGYITLQKYQVALAFQDSLLNQIEYRESDIYLRERLKKLYDGLVRVALQMSVNDDRFTRLALQYSEQFQSPYLKEWIFNRGENRSGNYQRAWGETLARLQRRKIELETLDAKELSPTSRLKVVQDSIHLLRKQLEAADSMLASQPSKPLELVDVGELQTNLSKEQVLVKFHLGQKRLSTWIIGSTEINVYTTPLPEGLIEHIRSFYGAVRSPRSSGSVDLLESGTYLYETLIRPIERHLEREIIIIPDEWLCYLPFEAMITKPAEKSYLYWKHQYLLERYTISYAYSLQLWQSIQNRPFGTTLDGVLSLAPVFDSTSSSYTPLYHNVEEESAILRSFVGKSLSNNPQIKRSFFEQADQYGIIHISTHGVLNDEYPALSHLVLSATDPRQNLYFDELQHLRLDSELILLSACQTNIGKRFVGEGVMSMGRAFRMAGVSSHIASLWNIDDRQSSVLISGFYQQLSRRSPKNRALQQAKLLMIKKGEDPKFAHPYYWAPLILSGNTKAAHLQRVGLWKSLQQAIERQVQKWI